MSEGTANTFFKDFNSAFRRLFEKEFIRPLEGEEFIQSSSVFSRMGLPGAIGSIDATFVGPWDACPSNLANVMEGDKGKGLLYQVIIDHCKLVLSVEGGYYGTVNDKCSVKYNDFITHFETTLEIYLI